VRGIYSSLKEYFFSRQELLTIMCSSKRTIFCSEDLVSWGRNICPSNGNLLLRNILHKKENEQSVPVPLSCLASSKMAAFSKLCAKNIFLLRRIFFLKRRTVTIMYSSKRSIFCLEE